MKKKNDYDFVSLLAGFSTVLLCGVLILGSVAYATGWLHIGKAIKTEKELAAWFQKEMAGEFQKIGMNPMAANMLVGAGMMQADEAEKTARKTSRK